jgi:hypothetical protein
MQLIDSKESLLKSKAKYRSKEMMAKGLKRHILRQFLLA